MKNAITTLFVFYMLVTCLQGNEASKTIYPLNIESEIYPNTIYYGDVVFVSLKMTNGGNEKIIIASNVTREMGYNLTSFQLLSQETGDVHIQWLDRDRAVPLATGGYIDAFVIPKTSLLLPGETMELCTRLLWVPPTSFIDEFVYERSGKNFSETTMDFEIDISVDFKRIKMWSFVVVSSSEKFEMVDSIDAIRFSKIEEHGYRVPDTIILRTHLRVQQRPKNEFELIRAWFLEAPSNYKSWFPEPLFELIQFDRDSPMRHSKELLKEGGMRRMQWLVDLDRLNEYKEFVNIILQRNDYSLARIERTNELAAQILERAKQPNSTISQNMVEFIQLRGFLVDMRYAENEEAEEAAFQGLMDFVDQSQDKELWVPFFHEIGLSSIQNFDHFPWQKVFQYCDRFAERFQIPKRGVIN
ncbi:MAG: hypothetical protein FWD31_05945 [Planctomycetaceae bacterium]|nr:hypothetical protein [Planctomycetaceae bacterium]